MSIYLTALQKYYNSPYRCFAGKLEHRNPLQMRGKLHAAYKPLQRCCPRFPPRTSSSIWIGTATSHSHRRMLHQSQLQYNGKSERTKKQACSMSMYKTSCKKSYTKKTNEVYAAAVFTVFYFPILFLDKNITIKQRIYLTKHACIYHIVVQFSILHYYRGPSPLLLENHHEQVQRQFNFFTALLGDFTRWFCNKTLPQEGYLNSHLSL